MSDIHSETLLVLILLFAGAMSFIAWIAYDIGYDRGWDDGNKASRGPYRWHEEFGEWVRKGGWGGG